MFSSGPVILHKGYIVALYFKYKVYRFVVFFVSILFSLSENKTIFLLCKYWLSLKFLARLGVYDFYQPTLI